MKKFLSIAAALVMVLSLSVVAFADTTVDSMDITASATLTILDGVDYTDESLYLYVYFTANDEEHYGWGAGALNDSGWASNIVSVDINEDGYVAFALTDIAAAYTEAGYDVADGVILNWWADYASLTGVELVSTSADAAAAETEETTDETEEAEATEEATEETTEEATEETTEEATEETTTTTSPSTGVALALVPMAIAGIAVVGSKKR
ncbi:MAG: hypothetical protein LUG23_09005 [Oscillospiraceae bacterium]|nr:hypothetical protein [Oscillospiraceae bacterium]